MCQMVIVLLMGNMSIKNFSLNICHSILQKIYFEFGSRFRTTLKTIHFDRGGILKIVNYSISEFLTVTSKFDNTLCLGLFTLFLNSVKGICQSMLEL